MIENVSVIRSFSYKTKILNFSICCNKIILLSQFTLDQLPLLLRKNQSFSSPKTSQQSARKPYCPLLLFNSPWFAVYCRVVLKKTNCILDKQPDTWQKNISLKNNLFIQETLTVSFTSKLYPWQTHCILYKQTVYLNWQTNCILYKQTTRNTLFLFQTNWFLDKKKLYPWQTNCILHKKTASLTNTLYPWQKNCILDKQSISLTNNMFTQETHCFLFKETDSLTNELHYWLTNKLYYWQTNYIIDKQLYPWQTNCYILGKQTASLTHKLYPWQTNCILDKQTVFLDKQTVSLTNNLYPCLYNTSLL